MSVIATALKHLIAAGVSGDDLVRAVAEMEAEVRAEPAPRTAGAIRQERYRRNKASQVTESDGCDAAPSLSRPPNEKISNPPTHTHPDKSLRARKAHRLPIDWTPSPLPTDLATAVAAWTEGMIERELSRFRDWAAGAPGQKGVKSDWDATWRNWLRKAEDEGRNRRNGIQPQPVRRSPGSRGERRNPCLDMLAQAEAELRAGGDPHADEPPWPPLRAISSG